MKPWLGLGLALILTAGVQAETLALTVKTKNADPGEEGVNFQTDYFVDSGGRLVREHTRRFDGGQVEPDRIYTWTETGVTWHVDGSIFRYDYALVSLGDHWQRTVVATGKAKGAKDTVQTTTIAYIGGPGTRWQDGTNLSIWDLSTGFQQRTLTEKNGDSIVFRYTTAGGILSRWTVAGESDRVSLERKSGRLTATYLGLFLEENGWVPTGTSVYTGPGLWNQDIMINLAHAAILDRYGDLPLWVPFVFQKDYLK